MNIQLLLPDVNKDQSCDAQLAKSANEENLHLTHSVSVIAFFNKLRPRPTPGATPLEITHFHADGYNS